MRMREEYNRLHWNEYMLANKKSSRHNNLPMLSQPSVIGKIGVAVKFY